jgi:hypothetical protein
MELWLQLENGSGTAYEGGARGKRKQNYSNMAAARFGKLS